MKMNAAIALSIVILMMLPIFYAERSDIIIQIGAEQLRAPVRGDSAPAVETPDDAAIWVITHTVHGFSTEEPLDSRVNITKLLMAIRRKGYAVTYCYGIAALYTWVLHKNGIPAFIIIAELADGSYHALAYAYYKEKLHPFYWNGTEVRLLAVIDPYPEDWSVPVPEIVKAVGVIPPYKPVTLKEYLEYATEKEARIVFFTKLLVENPPENVEIEPFWAATVLPSGRGSLVTLNYRYALVYLPDEVVVLATSNRDRESGDLPALKFPLYNEGLACTL